MSTVLLHPHVRRAVNAASLAFAMLLAARGAEAQTKTGTTLGQFLKIEPGARIAAMGNAGAASRSGLEAVYFNPAAIAGFEGRALHFTHSAWIADIGFEYAAAGMQVGTWGSAYASVTALNSGEIDVRTVTQPLGTGERYSVNDVAIALGFGREITDRFSVGGQVTYAQETIWHSSYNLFTLGFGTLYQVSDNGLRIGASLSNFGTQAGFSGRDLRILYDQDPDRYGDNGTLPAEIFTDAFPAPVLFRVGVGRPFRFGDALKLDVAVDADHPNDNQESVSLGSELAYRDDFAVRLGYQRLFLDDSEVGLTAGAGFGGDMADYGFHLDYAWAEHGRLGSTHRVSLGLSF